MNWEDDDALDMDALSASINVVAPPAPAPVAEPPAPAPAPKPKTVEPISVKKNASSSSIAAGASPLAPAAASKPAESPAASPLAVTSPAPLTATPADKLSIQKRRQRDIEDRSNSALAADLLGDVVVSEGPTSAELCAAVKASNLARPETVDALAASVAARLVALKTPREVMSFLRVLLPTCASELDSLYIKELTLMLADIDAANKAKAAASPDDDFM